MRSINGKEIIVAWLNIQGEVSNSRFCWMLGLRTSIPYNLLY